MNVPYLLIERNRVQQNIHAMHVKYKKVIEWMQQEQIRQEESIAKSNEWACTYEHILHNGGQVELFLIQYTDGGQERTRVGMFDNVEHSRDFIKRTEAQSQMI